MTIRYDWVIFINEVIKVNGSNGIDDGDCLSECIILYSFINAERPPTEGMGGCKADMRAHH